MTENNYIRLSELAECLGLSKPLITEYTGHYTLSRYLTKIKTFNEYAKRWVFCNHYYVSPHSLTMLRRYLEKRKPKENTLKAIEILNKWIQELINENNRERKRNFTNAVPT
ncbi:MAG: hypothetical protein NC191_03735 [Muribaculaceae bacterium]|nr:hypothetical protein [Muribaculaceae bacterium]